MTSKKSDVEDQMNEPAEFEGEIREFVRRDVAPWRRRADATQMPHQEGSAESVSFLVQRVAGATVQEIDQVIIELQAVREILRKEGERVQNEISSYANLSQSAMATLKVIGECTTQWRTTLGNSSIAQNVRLQD